MQEALFNFRNCLEITAENKTEKANKKPLLKRLFVFEILFGARVGLEPTRLFTGGF
ncbi:hypothetical protein AC062_2329 [Pasteurellaceae bacterium NI1060]|nr:hypothetical protein AC062_2329 [Pasteurellaceae bacterium NI1060]